MKKFPVKERTPLLPKLGDRRPGAYLSSIHMVIISDTANDFTAVSLKGHDSRVLRGQAGHVVRHQVGNVVKWKEYFHRSSDARSSNYLKEKLKAIFYINFLNF